MDFSFLLSNGNPVSKSSSSTTTTTLTTSIGSGLVFPNSNPFWWYGKSWKNISLRLIGTTHVDCGSSGGGVVGLGSNSNSQQQQQQQQQQQLSSSSSSQVPPTSSVSSNSNNNTISSNANATNSNSFTCRSVSWNSSGGLLAIASSCSTVRLVTVDSSSSAPALSGTTAASSTTAATTSTLLHASASSSSNGSSALTTHSSLSTKDVVTITGHTAPVVKVRFHPVDSNLLCSAAMDGTVQIWDVRNASQRSVGKIDISNGPSAIAVEWGWPSARSTANNINNNINNINNSDNILQVTERDSSIYIYDVRKLSSPNATTSNNGGNSNAAGTSGSSGIAHRSNSSTITSGTAALCTFKMNPNVVETCLFTPDGNHIITGSTCRGEGIGELRIFPWRHWKPFPAATLDSVYRNNLQDNLDDHNTSKKRSRTSLLDVFNQKNKIQVQTNSEEYSSDALPASQSNKNSITQNNSNNNEERDISSITTKTIIATKTYPAHAGPIYTMAYSSQGTYLATGGSDATVCLWDVQSMCCIQSITRRTRFIRSVAFSPDESILAVSSEEDGIDLTYIPTGEAIGLAYFHTTNTNGTGNNNSTNASSTYGSRMGGGGGLGGRGTNFEGAEEIAFHPSKDIHLLACARTTIGPIPTAPVTIVKLHITANSNN